MDHLFDNVDNFAIYKDVESVLQYGKKEGRSTPVISVIMPIYKNPEMFRTALDSVLAQECEFEYEIVVVDNEPYDGGSDGSLEYVEKINSDKVLYYRNADNIGMYGNWNRGIELSNAEYVTYCHNDDILEPYALQRLHELQLKYGDRLIASEFNLIDDKGNYIKKLDPDRRVGFLRQKKDFIYTRFDIFLNNVGFGVGCLFNRKNLIALGGFNKDYYPSADYALFAKYIFMYGGVFNRVPTFDYRKSENESYSTYMDFVERDKFFRECMLDHMKLPKWLGKKLINANYNYGSYNFAQKWGGKSDIDEGQKCTFNYKLMELVNKINSIRRFSLTAE